MRVAITAEAAREALAALPAGTSYGEKPEPANVYLPPSHVKALAPDAMLVTGMRGAGKTFWWKALQDSRVLALLAGQAGPGLGATTEVRTGFGVPAAPDKYPGKEHLRQLLEKGVEPWTFWRAIVAWQLAEGHPLRDRSSWRGRISYVEDHPEEIDRLFQRRDSEFERTGRSFLILFDALDRCADDWKAMYRMIRGLLQTALDLRSYRRLRVKIFLRDDQADPTRIADFPDASKVLASSVELTWPRRELYGLLWNYLANGSRGEEIRAFLRSDEWAPAPTGGRTLFFVPRHLVFREEDQRRMFHHIAGKWMGAGPKRGFPYTWIPNHLSDTRGRVSPRSFLAALRRAADDTGERHPDHDRALHFESIHRGVAEASKIRVAELQEDYPWVDRLLGPLNGLAVPCRFGDISERWKGDVLDGLTQQVRRQEIKLPPHLGDGLEGVRRDLESLGVFYRMHDERVNIPDIFRVAYRVGRRGGVKPVR